MAHYMVDANLPSKIRLFNSTDFVFARDLKIERDDFKIWEYAAANKQTILTRDYDFYKILLARGYPPKIIWLRLLSCTTREISLLLAQNWAIIQSMERRYALVEVGLTYIQGHFPTEQEASF